MYYLLVKIAYETPTIHKIIIKLIKNPKNLDKDKKPIESEKNIKEKVVKKEKKKSDNVFVETSAESNKSASKSDKKDVQYSDNSSLQTIDWPF